MTERPTSALVSGRHLSADEVRSIKFASQALGGYKTDEVNRFMGRVARELDRLYQQLEESGHRGAQAHQAAENMAAQLSQLGQQQPPGETVRLLQLAQHTADQVEAQARQEAAQMLEHARQQAQRMVAEATRHAEAEARQLIDNATVESRRKLAAYLELGERVQHGLQHGTVTLSRLLTEWAEEAGPEVAVLAGTPAPAPSPEPAAETAAEPETATTPAARRTGGQRRSQTQTGPAD